VLLIIVFIIMFKVDWEKRVEKYLGESKEDNQPTEDTAVKRES
jgi:hypothetical protein